MIQYGIMNDSETFLVHIRTSFLNKTFNFAVSIQNRRKLLRLMNKIIFLIVSLFFVVIGGGCDSSTLQQRKYSPEIDSVLTKAGINHIELEKALDYFYYKKDSVKMKAIEFLVANMDIHYSETYYWKDLLNGNKIEYSEFDYPDFESAVKGIDSLKSKYGLLTCQDTIIYDMYVLSSEYLIGNVNYAVDTWRISEYRDISFEDFCEYILPYRVTTEPIADWRVKYQTRFQWLGDSICNKSLKNILGYAAIDYKDWFIFTTGKEYRDEPLPRLSAQQLLFRKKGPCEDVASLETFIFRSQAIPAAYITIPLWATSAGAHFANTVFEKNMNPIKFDITMNIPVNHELPREPAKVIRHTYSKQKETLAMYEKKENIPPGYMQHPNYIDVTHEYWETSNVTVPLFTDTAQIVYAGIFSRSEWNAEWWGRQHCDSVTFSNMPKGIVILPMTYNKGKFKVAGYPVVNGFNHQLFLIPDTVHTRSITITEQDKYLRFRPGKRYELFYWNNRWKSLGVQTATVESSALQFVHVPRNVLMLLIPEYSEEKERPFIIMDDGSRYWW